jgi:hypothetical protein
MAAAMLLTGAPAMTRPAAAASCDRETAATLVKPQGVRTTMATPGTPLVGSSANADTSAPFQLDVSSIKKARSAPVQVTVSWASATSEFDISVGDQFGFTYGTGTAATQLSQQPRQVVVTAPIENCAVFIVTAENKAGNPNEKLTVAVKVGDALATARPTSRPLPRDGWTAIGSPGATQDPASNALDGDPKTRWSTGAPQTPAELLQVDLARATTFSRIVMDTGTGYGSDFPRTYEIQASNDLVTWQTVASGIGTAVSDSRFSKVTARYLRVHLTSVTFPVWWSVAELNLYRECFAGKAGC